MAVKLESPSGVIDGVNTVFTTPSDYVSGSVVVFLNGQALVDVVIEQPPRDLEIPVECVPRVGDVLCVYYRSL